MSNAGSGACTALTDVTTRRRLRLPADPRSVASARRAVSDACEHAGLPASVVDTTMLLASETVTNAVLHGRGDVRLVIEASPHGLRVEVGDDSARLPVRRGHDLEATDGRGVALLEALALAWGAEASPPGKVVWFELDA